MVSVTDLPTPVAVVDLDVVERNCAHMSERMSRLGTRLRPHVKTHKCVEAALLSVEGHFGGITVSTLAEARAFGAAGFADITYAVPLAPAKAAAAVALGAEVGRLALLVDSDEAADAVAHAGRSAARDVPVYLKLDCGYHRAGVAPDGAVGPRLARRLADARGIEFRGVLAHGGHAYYAAGREAIAVVAAAERDVTVGFAERLRAEGLDVPEVSIGSTPTMAVIDDLSGITEVRPGNYVFFDRYQSAIDSCAPEDCALSVIVTVIGAYPARGTAIVDGGATAFSKDAGATHVSGWDGGYGAVLDAESGADTGLTLASLSQEHGELRGDAAALASLRVGRRLRIVPNHSCLTAALFERFHVARGGDVVGEWRPVRGW